MRAIGSDLHMDYSAMGETTHLAARMEQIGQAGRRPVSTGETLKLAEGYVAGADRWAPVIDEGLGRAREVFELTGASAARYSFPGRRGAGVHALRGTRRELEGIAEALAKAGAGKARWSLSWANPA